jgi:glucose-1-phosphate adenylyltransferase
VSTAADAEIYDSVIFPGAIIGSGTKVFRSIIGENAVIGSNCIIGGPLRAGDVVDNKLTGDITVIGDDLYVNAGTYLPCGSIVNEDIQGGRVL